MKPNVLLYTGIASALYSIYAFANYYTYTGSQLISSNHAKKLLSAGNVQVVDVRTKMEYNLGHYPGAIHIPVSSMNEKSVENLSKSKVIIVYCNTGQRARHASEILKNFGFPRVYYIAESYKTITKL